MSGPTPEEKSWWETWIGVVVIIFAATALVAGIYFGILVPIARGFHGPSAIEKYGQIGDSLGALTCLFAALAFGFSILTNVSQTKELGQQRTLTEDGLKVQQELKQVHTQAALLQARQLEMVERATNAQEVATKAQEIATLLEQGKEMQRFVVDLANARASVDQVVRYGPGPMPYNVDLSGLISLVATANRNPGSVFLDRNVSKLAFACLKIRGAVCREVLDGIPDGQILKPKELLGWDPAVRLFTVAFHEWFEREADHLGVGKAARPSSPPPDETTA